MVVDDRLQQLVRLGLLACLLLSSPTYPPTYLPFLMCATKVAGMSCSFW